MPKGPGRIWSYLCTSSQVRIKYSLENRDRAIRTRSEERLTWMAGIYSGRRAFDPPEGTQKTPTKHLLKTPL